MITPYSLLKVRSAFWKVMGRRVALDIKLGLGEQGFMVIP